MEQNVDVELNLFYMHYNDAKKFSEWAEGREKDTDANPSIYARHSIISTVFASEALINRVLSEFSADKNIFQSLEKTNILDKWYLAPHLCSENSKLESFDKSKEPYQSFKELVQIRNWFAHPKVENFLPAKNDPNSTISIGTSKEEYPWLEMLKGDFWKQTKIPKNPFEIDHTHAKSALEILDSMIEELKSKLRGRLYDGWLNEILVKDQDGLHNYRVSVHTIWGGYGGSDS